MNAILFPGELIDMKNVSSRNIVELIIRKINDADVHASRITFSALIGRESRRVPSDSAAIDAEKRRLGDSHLRDIL